MSKQERTLLWITEGATITNNGRDYIIVSLADINLVLAKEVGSNEKVLLKIGDLGPPKKIGEPKTPLAVAKELAVVSEEDWAVAEERRRHIEPLLRNDYQKSNALADQAAAAAGVSRATIYRWLAAFRETGLLSSLILNPGGKGGKRPSRLSPEV